MSTGQIFSLRKQDNIQVRLSTKSYQEAVRESGLSSPEPLPICGFRKPSFSSWLSVLLLVLFFLIFFFFCCDWTSLFSFCQSWFLSFFASTRVTGSHKLVTFYSTSTSPAFRSRYIKLPPWKKVWFNSNSADEMNSHHYELAVFWKNNKTKNKTTLPSSSSSRLCPYLSHPAVNQSRSRQGGSRRMHCAVMDSTWVTTLINKQINQPEPRRRAPPTPTISQNDRRLLTPPWFVQYSAVLGEIWRESTREMKYVGSVLSPHGDNQPTLLSKNIHEFSSGERCWQNLCSCNQARWYNPSPLGECGGYLTRNKPIHNIGQIGTYLNTVTLQLEP